MPEFLRDPEFWILVSALVLFASLWKPLKRSLLGALDARAQRIRSELEEAKKIREEAQRMLAEYREKERQAESEAKAIIDHARAEAERIALQSAEDLEAALKRRRRLAEERLAQAEARAVGEIRALAIDLAIAAAKEAITRNLDEARGSALIDNAIAELSRQFT